MTTPRQPREESSSTAQIRRSADVSPGKRPITFVGRRTSTKVRSKRFVERIRLRCARGAQVATEVEPVLVALPRAELQPKQHFPPLERDAPGDQHALGRRVVGPQLQIDGVEEEVDEVVLVQPPAAPGAVSLARVGT